MRLTVLGKYGPFPAKGGACSSYLIEDDETKILLDLGSGAFSRLRSLIKPNDLDAVVITHFHYDHCSDLGVMQYALQAERVPLLKVFSLPADRFSFDAPYEWNEAVVGEQVQIGSIRLQFYPAKHPVPCIGVKVTSVNGASLFYTGDTAFFEELAGYAMDSDILLADTCLLRHDPKVDKPAHMTAQEVGDLAKKAKVKKLLCTHIFGGGADEKEILKAVDFCNATVVEERTCYEVKDG